MWNKVEQHPAAHSQGRLWAVTMEAFFRKGRMWKAAKQLLSSLQKQRQLRAICFFVKRSLLKSEHRTAGSCSL